MKNSVGIIKDLSWSYRNKKLFEKLSTNFPKDSFISIIGPNGSGKSTLLRHLLRALPAARGTILLPNGDLNDYTQRSLALHLSYVPQQSKLEYEFTVFEAVAMGRYAHNLPLASLSYTDKRIINESLDSMNILHLANQRATELSGGEYQRMLIARALAQQSSVILLDEPVSHLDVHNQKEILNLLRKLVDENRATVIAVLHDLNAVSAFSDLVIMLKQGEIVAEGDVNTVLTKERIEDVYKTTVSLLNGTNERPIILQNWK